ncbi:MbnP family copper-binding protein [Oceanospirillum maris]|uniref:MbnP family copper-binding protein n=1 Tax=Oceanospirillum maris TaxID=64977 RepID=UPI00040E200B|nr:MbnP family copper-binding protein [Oceanospirillum maris]
MMKKLMVCGTLASIATLTGCLGSDDDNDTASAVQKDVAIQFAGEVNGQPFSCADTYAGLGTNNSSAVLTDFRLYLNNVNLIDAEGNKHPVTLKNDGAWQTDEVVLLDFETGDGSCTSGTAATNMLVSGTVAEGDYTGIEFNVGVPGQTNHQDSTAAPSPLNISGLFWRWQSGYKHARIDLKLDTPYDYTDSSGAAKTGTSWFLHLGSTDCSGDPTLGETVTCGNPNRPTITLNDFNIEANKVIVDYGKLIATTNLSTPTPGPFGCMSGATDADCVEVFKNLGITGDQTLFGKGSL